MKDWAAKKSLAPKSVAMASIIRRIFTGSNMKKVISLVIINMATTNRQAIFAKYGVASASRVAS